VAPAKEHLAIEQTSGRQRLNIHGAIDLETGKTAMIDVEGIVRLDSFGRRGSVGQSGLSAAARDLCASRRRRGNHSSRVRCLRRII
jgi:hypothetical protein